MNTKILIPAVAAVFSASSLAIASGDSPGQRYFSPMLGYVVADDERVADDGAAIQLGIGQVISDAWNFELNISADQMDLTNGADEYQQHGVGVEGLYFFSRGTRFSPYGLIGVGGLRTELAGNVNSGIMASVGAGVITGLTDGGTALRLEVRNRWDENDESVATEHAFSDWIINVGLAVPFGSAGSKAAIPADTDGDGIADSADRCPATPAGAAVDASGCELVSDSDRDGVSDRLDKCPGTASGTTVRADGCEADADGDGIADSRDRCPGTPANTAVDASGCAPDSDGDGVVDAQDACAGTNKGDAVDDRGCVVLAERVTLKGVNFANNSAKLADSSRTVLDNMADILRKHPRLRIEVAGHTDNTGAAAHNVLLSQQRAEAVRRYLISQGIDGSRMVAKGYGPTKPVTSNATAAERAENRRVELGITGK